MSTAKNRHEFFTERARDMQARKDSGQNSRFVDFYCDAYADYASEAKRDIALECAKDRGDLLDLRFIGPRAENGFLPLHQFLEILTPMNKGLNAAARRLRSGKESTRNDDACRDAMGLQMAGMADGSARVLVLGDNRADLTGTSLFATTMVQTFRLLTAPSADFYDAVDAVGGVAARHIGDALHQTDKNGLAAEFAWQRSEEPNMLWHGTPGEIRRVTTLIDTTKEPEKFEQVIEGVVSSIADNGRIVLRVGEDKQRVRFPLNLIDDVQKLNIMQPVKLKVSTAKYWDAVLKLDVFKHTLLRVSEESLPKKLKR